MKKLSISIVIPTLNEAQNLPVLLQRIASEQRQHDVETIVVDGGSKDQTSKVASEYGVRFYQSPKANRAIQMNLGAQQANHPWLYFIHADTLPPVGFLDDIKNAIAGGHRVGCFRYQFDSPKKLLKVNAFFTRYNFLWCRGGDQSLYISKMNFMEMGRFDESCQIMEDFNFICRLRKRFDFHVIQKDFLVSARKYENNSYLRVQFANLIVFNMFRLGFSSTVLRDTYGWLLRYRY